MAAAPKRSPVTYMWRTKSAPGWAAETRMLKLIETETEERAAIDAWECNGTQYGLADESKSDLVLAPCCLGNGGAHLGGLALCDSYLAADGIPTKVSGRLALAKRLDDPAAMGIGLQVGFTVRANVTEDPGTCVRANPTNSPLARAILGAHLDVVSIRAAKEGTAVEIVVGMGAPLDAADQCELVQAVCAGFSDARARVVEVWASTSASRGENGAAALLTRLTAASNKAGVSANSRSGRFYIPASVARVKSGHYIDQQPATCGNSYEYVMNVIDLWAEGH